MANLLPINLLLTFFGTVILLYDILTASGREKKDIFCIGSYTRFIFLQISSSSPTVLFPYLFHLETATLKL